VMATGHHAAVTARPGGAVGRVGAPQQDTIPEATKVMVSF
jgi:hypothetical protein